MVFWDNLLRYPRFFISSMLGLILILLTPIIEQLKKFNDKRIIYFFLISILITLFCILKEMLSIE
uniref:Ycf33 n=1 Tax=Alaria crassifolia TaxID=98220 RepID=UPI001D10D83D|nr:Ycf33 [Alaria crassifolia]YP_010207145.1 Ycf33 [Alaria praelonga]UAX21601.1 Ycf33 [Alaria crassifolia]UAX21742.1 Ycf33 [Alaria praelonga]